MTFNLGDRVKRVRDSGQSWSLVRLWEEFTVTSTGTNTIGSYSVGEKGEVYDFDLELVPQVPALATPAPTGDDERVKSLAYAWLDHQGYTAADIAEGEAESHEQAGCEYTSGIGYYQHTDENEKSLHPLMDAVSEASEWAYFAVEHFSRSHPETPTSETVTMTREELSAWALANDAGFGMYKRQHWDGCVRELFDANTPAARSRQEGTN